MAGTVRRRNKRRGVSVEANITARRSASRQRAANENARKLIAVCGLILLLVWSFSNVVMVPIWTKRCLVCCDEIGIPPMDVEVEGICGKVSPLRALLDTLANSQCDQIFSDDASPTFGIPAWVSVQGKVKFADYASLLEEGATLYEPVIILNAPSMKWPALKKWTPQFLQSAAPNLVGVKSTRDRSNVFVYEDMSRAHSALHTSNIEISNMSSADFFASSRPVYFSDAFEQWEDILGNDVTPRDFMRISDGGTAGAHLWLSSDAVIAALHYDSYHNIFAQIRGCKRFIIAELREHTKVKLFPLHHPNNRQSQLELSNALPLPEKDRPGVFIADLFPGDVLYLPPFTFHRVAAFPAREQSMQ